MTNIPRIWLTTDTHFNHEKLIEWGRPIDFESRIYGGLSHAMNNVGDVLVHLGDLAVGKDGQAILLLQTATRLAPITLVRGNHDQKSTTWYLRRGIHLVCDELVLTVNKKRVLLTHIPKPRRAGIDHNIHGHTHGNAHRAHEMRDFYESGYHIELALEHNGYKPWLLSNLV